MKKFRLQLLAAIAIVIGFVLLLGVAGEIDFVDSVIVNMSQEDYDSVKLHLTDELGHQPSEREIAHWWAEHH